MVSLRSVLKTGRNGIFRGLPRKKAALSSFIFFFDFRKIKWPHYPKKIRWWLFKNIQADFKQKKKNRQLMGRRALLYDEFEFRPSPYKEHENPVSEFKFLSAKLMPPVRIRIWNGLKTAYENFKRPTFLCLSQHSLVTSRLNSAQGKLGQKWWQQEFIGFPIAKLNGGSYPRHGPYIGLEYLAKLHMKL